jgi:hypothetical protein
MDRSEEISRFYDILGKLERRIGGKRTLADCSKGTGWPNRGVYFFFEAGEIRSGSGMGPRVVRVGTHGLKLGANSTFWQRLSQHRGSERGGNHRGSIFRSLVGEALKGEGQNMEPESWGIGSDPGKGAAKLGVSHPDIIDRERELEVRVSRYIGGMPFVWLPIEDEPGPKSSRGYIERNTIALLSNYAGNAVDSPSANWLGRFSSRERVRQSGLWNNNHVDEKHEIDFLNRFAQLVSQI